MSYALDTNAVSALMKGSAAVVERLAATEPAEVGVPQPVDAAIAAHALALDATLVTGDLNHLRRVPGLRIEDWSVERK